MGLLTYKTRKIKDYILFLYEQSVIWIKNERKIS